MECLVSVIRHLVVCLSLSDRSTTYDNIAEKMASGMASSKEPLFDISVTLFFHNVRLVLIWTNPKDSYDPDYVSLKPTRSYEVKRSLLPETFLYILNKSINKISSQFTPQL